MLRPPQHQVESARQKEAEALLQSPGQLSRGAVSSTQGHEEEARRQGPAAGPSHSVRVRTGRAHRSAHGLAPVNLTLLRIGLRILLARSRVQQLFQLQRQGLWPRHRHQPRLRARECAAPAWARTLSPGRVLSPRDYLLLGRVRHRAELRAQLPTGNFREARGRGRGLSRQLGLCEDEGGSAWETKPIVAVQTRVRVRREGV